MAKATAALIQRELGVLNELEMARLVALEPSEEEVVEARAWLSGDDEVNRSLGKPSTAKVRQMVELVRAALEEEEPDLLDA